MTFYMLGNQAWIWPRPLVMNDGLDASGTMQLGSNNSPTIEIGNDKMLP